jgi:hypothetical protein
VNHAAKMKNILDKTINEHLARRAEFVRNPLADFTRDSPFNMENTIRFILEMGGNSLPIELEKFFNHSEDTPTKSAFVQQRQKLLPSAFKSIFDKFNKQCEDDKRYRGYRLYAADGTALNVALDPDAESHVARSNGEGYNQLHINTLYDLCNKTYTDVFVQPIQKLDERGALETMLGRYTFSGKNILTLDRGYEGYNMIAHLLNKDGLDFVLRVRQGVNAFSGIAKLPMTTFDTYVDINISTTQTKDDKENGRIFVNTSKSENAQRWDFPSPYTMRVRVVRFMINDVPDEYGSVENNPDNYETIITSLSPDEFSVEDIKELYHLRWGIETSYRDLKYSIGLVNLHAKIEDSVLQEIYAHFIMYNFCSRIAMSVEVEQSEENKYEYQLNFRFAYYECKCFMSGKLSGSRLLRKIRKCVEPVRPGRSDKRKIKPASFVPFNYRVAG